MRKIALVLVFLVALLLGGAQFVRGQSALDGFDPNANGRINIVVVQPDGKILLGGDFTTLSPNGGPAATRNRIARLNADGSLDTVFNPNANSVVYAIAVQTDGKVVAGGDFTYMSGIPRINIARLDATTGAPDSFNPGSFPSGGSVRCLAVQPDGKILAGGDFGIAGHIYIVRLDPVTGSADSFNPNPNGELRSIVVQADGKILAGGLFTRIGGEVRNHIARLDGTNGLADSFDPNASGTVHGNLTIVNSITVQADGKILAGGVFASIGGQPRRHIARLDAVTGLADAFDPNANGTVLAITMQPDGKILVVGNFDTSQGQITIGGQTRNYVARLDPATGAADSFNPNSSNTVRSIALQADDKILIAGDFSNVGAVTRTHIARLETDGRLDRTLNLNMIGPLTSFVNAIAVQPDGKLLIGGTFTAVLGVARKNIARLNTDGTLDTAFDPNANNEVDTIAVQPDGKILVGGFFNQNIGATTIGGQTRNYIARLDATTGSADSFNPNANNLVRSIAVQSDGKILVGGFFTSIGGATRNRIARLDANSGIADTFDPNANGNVFSITIQPDDKILVGGAFNGANSIGGATRNRMARLDASNGLADAFDPNANGTVFSIALQNDGKILAGGAFNGASSIGGAARNRIARLDPANGLADSFDPNANDLVESIAVQSDGKILAGGFFNGANSIGGQTRNRIARLDAVTGLADAFDPNANGTVFSIALQSDGKILAGGTFNGANSIGGQARDYFARLSNDTPALQNLSVHNQGATWTLGGSKPQFTRVTFEYSTDNITYGSPANGILNGSQWSFSALAFPYEQNFYIRARGYYRSGIENGSESVMESVRSSFLQSYQPLQVVSRKVHGDAGPFDINLPLTGSPGIECRSGGVGNDYQMVLTFAVAAHFESASVTSGIGSVSGISGSGTTTITVNLAGVANAQRIAVTLSVPSDGGADIVVPMDVLVGDVTGNRAVNGTDVTAVKQISHGVEGSNFRADVIANGVVNSSDISMVKFNSGTALP
jgi:uncharacterized delta-60 repeat protein